MTGFLVSELQEIELRAILNKPEPVLIPSGMLEQVVPNIVVPEPPFVANELTAEAEADIEPTIKAPVVVPEIDDEDVDEDEEQEMDSKESDQFDEDMDAIAPGPTPIADIAQIVAIWAAEMATQPDGFEIGE